MHQFAQSSLRISNFCAFFPFFSRLGCSVALVLKAVWLHPQPARSGCVWANQSPSWSCCALPSATGSNATCDTRVEWGSGIRTVSLEKTGSSKSWIWTNIWQQTMKKQQCQISFRLHLDPFRMISRPCLRSWDLHLECQMMTRIWHGSFCSFWDGSFETIQSNWVWFGPLLRPSDLRMTTAICSPECGSNSSTCSRNRVQQKPNRRPRVDKGLLEWHMSTAKMVDLVLFRSSRLGLLAMWLASKLTTSLRSWESSHIVDQSNICWHDPSVWWSDDTHSLVSKFLIHPDLCNKFCVVPTFGNEPKT